MRTFSLEASSDIENIVSLEASSDDENIVSLESSGDENIVSWVIW